MTDELSSWNGFATQPFAGECTVVNGESLYAAYLHAVHMAQSAAQACSEAGSLESKKQLVRALDALDKTHIAYRLVLIESSQVHRRE